MSCTIININLKESPHFQGLKYTKKNNLLE